MATPISILDGDYRINGGTWTNASGMINNGDTLQVRRNSSPLYATQVGTSVTVGSYTTDFLITTKVDEPCVRPEGMNSELFIFTWSANPDSVPVPFDFSQTSVEEACTALDDYRTYVNESVASLSYYPGEFENTFGVGSTLFRGGFADCTKVPNGFYWYKPGTSIGAALIAYRTPVVYIVTVVDGVVTNITSCDTFTATRTADFQKNDCTGEDTGSFVTYSKEYSSTISEGDAQAQADADASNFLVEGQLQANEDGECFAPLPSDAVGIVVIDLYQAIDVCAFVDTPGVVPYQMPIFAGNNFLPNDGTPPENCWALSSDAINTGGIRRRFEFNVARLLNTYPSITDYTFRVRGRGTGGGTMNGAYSLKGADAGNMIMTGSPGSYIPSVVSASDLGVIGYSGKPFIGGADGNIGLAYGADILVFTYNVASKTLTLL